MKEPTRPFSEETQLQPMSISSVASFVDVVVRTGLLEPEQLEALTRKLQARFTDPKALAKELLQRRWLTSYQIHQLFHSGGQDLVLGSYVLLERLGEGGMGQVFKARHRTLDRVVALKIIRKERLASADAVRRFQREIRAAAQLAHPNIVHAFDANEVAGTHFLVMEYVDGTNLAALVKGSGPLAIDQACDYIRQAALGLHHAHERGLIHRDIKPANLLVSVVSSPLSVAKDSPQRTTDHWPRATVKILDLGLARLTGGAEASDASSTTTQEGIVMGTPDYIAPEQARESHTADYRADLYSLGCTFYHLLTGQVPFPGGTLTQKLLKHQLEEPTPVEQLRQGLPAPVAEIVRKLMAKAPEYRYQSAAELAADLTNIATPARATCSLSHGGLGDKAEGANQAGTSDTVPHWSSIMEPASTEEALDSPRRQRQVEERRRWLVFNLSGAALLGVGLVVVLFLLFRDSGTERRQVTKEEPPPGLIQTKKTADSKTPLDQGKGKKLAADPEAQLKREAARNAYRAQEEKIQKQRAAEAEAAFPELATKFQQKNTTFASFAKEVAAFKAKHGGTGDHLIHVWDVDARKHVRTLTGHKGWVMGLAFSSKEPALASGSRDGSVRLWDTNSGKELRTLVHIQGAGNHDWQVAFSPDGTQVAAVPTGGGLIVWEAKTGSELAKRPGHTTVSFCPGHQHVVLCGSGSDLLLWEPSTGKEQLTIKGAACASAAFSPDGRGLVTGHADGTVRLWDVVTGKEVQPLGDQPVRLVFSPNCKHALTRGAKGSFHLWDLETWQLLKRLEGIEEYTYFGFAPDGRRFLFVRPDHSLRLWDVELGQELQSFAGHRDAVYQAGFSPDGRRFLSGSWDDTIRLWDLDTGAELRTFKGCTNHIEGVAWCPDGRRFISSSGDNTTRLWEVETGRELDRLTTAHRPSGAAVSPDGRRTAFGCRDGSLWLCELVEGCLRKPAMLKGPHSSGLNFIEFFPDGKTLVSSGEHGLVTLWNAVTGKSLREWQFPGWVYASIAPDGRHLATANANGTVYILRLPDDLLPPKVLSAEQAKKQQEDEAKRLGTAVQIENSLGMKLNLIPPGRFLMGSSADEIELAQKERPSWASADSVSAEGPQHEVHITKPFYMGIHEVTVGQFRAFVKATGYQTEAEKSGQGAFRHFADGRYEWDKNINWHNPGFDQTQDHPVVCVSWKDAKEFCDWLSKRERKKYRLPTEAEWEYACRAGTQTRYSCGDDDSGLKEVANLGDESRKLIWPTWPHQFVAWDDGYPSTAPVGRFKPNAFGLHDMHGNALEWVSDWWDATYYAKSPKEDPNGPESGARPVLRGSDFLSNTFKCRCAFRSSHPSQPAWIIGFRVVCDYRPPQITNSIGMKLARIPPGKFLMGSQENELGRQANEGPQHEVTITKPFHIGVYEVTQAEYERVTGKNPSKFNKANRGGPDHPVEMVSWDDAAAFCKKLSELPEETKAGRVYRLPTEAEWEYACRAGTRTAYYFGDDASKLGEYGWYADNSQGKTHPVGQKLANPWGLYDMHGNVWEWCEDWYEDYRTVATIDPQGPGTGTERAGRSGAWGDPSPRIAARGHGPPPMRNDSLGFRVVCEVRPPPSKGK
jgi:serine/threonine-protein kinase